MKSRSPLLLASTLAALLAAGCAAPGSAPAAAAAAPAPADPADLIKAALPVIPDAQFKLTDYGAVGDGKTMNTDAFKQAIDAVAQAGGGHLEVPPGVYKTLRFSLVSKLDLHLDAGATIKFPEKLEDYGIPDPNQPQPEAAGRRRGFGRAQPLISGTNLSDVAITGSGTIDGSGAIFWQWSDKAARRYPPGRTVVPRPMLVVLSGMKRLHIQGILLTNSPMFHLLLNGDDMTIEDIRVEAPSDSPNTDAIDPAGHRVIVRNCEIDTGDDHVALHAGSSDMLVENLTCLHGHGISVGSGTRGGLSHVYVRHCTFDWADNGLRIKSYRGGGGEVHDIHYSNITMRNVRRPFDINTRYDGNDGLATDVGPREAKAGQTQNIPNFHDIHVDHLTVVNSPIAGRIIGLPEAPAADFTFSEVKIRAVKGFLVQDAKNITFTNTEITNAVGPTLVTSNATVHWNGTPVSGDQGGDPEKFY